jgi:hypothetical protein
LPPAAPVEEGKLAPELVRIVRQGLVRVGCATSALDGAWGKKDQTAVETFARYSRLTLASLDPSADLLGQIEAHAGRVCPLVCGAAYEAKGDSCVRKSCPPGMTMGSRGECKAPPRQASPANPSGGNKTATAGASGGSCSTGYYPCKLNANGRLDATHPNCCLNVPGFGHAK